MRPPPRTPALAVVAVAGVAAAWFWPGIHLTLEWLDQGQIVYGAWRVARGDLQYRDFDHVYGPSLFLLNGALLRWSGEDLLAVRLGLLAVKTALATSIFLAARTVARTGIALAVTVFFITLWGAPVWIFATPYAGHYTLACSFAGLLLLLAAPDGRWWPALAAGLCAGVGATFKQTTGLFGAASMLVVLASAPPPPGVRDGLAAPARWLRLAVATATALLVVGYVSRALDSATAAVLIAPPLLALVVEWLRDLPDERALPAGRPRLARTLAFGAGFAVPLLLWTAYFASRGAVADLVHDTLVGLPQRIDWWVPLDPPDPRTLAFAAAAVVGVAGVATGRMTLLVPAALVVAGLVVAIAVVPGWGIVDVEALRFLPIALVWGAAPLALRRGDAVAPRLLWWFAALACLSLHPGSDWAHAHMIVPATLPLLALLLDAGWTATATRPFARAGLAVLAGMPLVGQMAQDVGLLRRAVAARPVHAPEFDRATGVWDEMPRFGSMRDVMGRLDRLAPRGTPLLVLPSAQLLYVLADRPSALPHAEMVLYLLSIDVIRPEDARALLSEDDMIAALAAERPLVVRSPDGAWQRIAVAFPKLAAWLDGAYAVTETVGGLQILRPRSG